MVEKKEGNKMTCLGCDDELVCGWSKPSGGYAPKLQWQNSDKTAHFTKFDGSKYVCPNQEEISDVGKIQKPQGTVEQGWPKKNEEQKLIEAKNMVELLWIPALEKSKEVYGIKDNVTNNKDVMILAQVFFKAMVENYNK